MIPDRRHLILGACALTLPAQAWAGARSGLSAQEGSRTPDDISVPGLILSGRRVQGGAILGQTWPGATVAVDGQDLTTASDRGLFVVGLDRDAASTVNLSVRTTEGRSAHRTVRVMAGSFASTRINGLPASTIAPGNPALLERIRREVALKTAAFASRTEADDFADGFVWPLSSYRVSSSWGAQRVLNGTPARPHYGIDLAAPRGATIRAPAAGLVVLAQPDMHFEGGLTLIDHGQGLVSAYLHQSALSVHQGQRVAQGDVIGQVGSTGRATGPHLCWRLKWRDRNLDPSLMIGEKFSS